jgi:hypothetical protein
METWRSLLTDIRADLQDTSETPRWASALLLTYTKDAVRDYSIWFPLRVDKLELVPIMGQYPLPANYVEDIQVECPLDTLLERRRDRPGNRYVPNSMYYTVQGGNLYIAGSPLHVYLTYFAAHPVPAGVEDIDFQFTIPDTDIELIRLYVKAKIQALVRGRQANLDRFKATGTRDDNPLVPETENLMDEYYRKIAERVPGGVVALYRMGRLA